jgi:hypothetical protein
LVQLAEAANEIHYSLAQQRLPACDADFRDPKRDEYACHAQVIFKWQLAVERAFVAGPAIDALVVAAVGDRDPQVGDGATEFVLKKQL